MIRHRKTLLALDAALLLAAVALPGHHIELVANDLVIREHTDSDGGN